MTPFWILWRFCGSSHRLCCGCIWGWPLGPWCCDRCEMSMWWELPRALNGRAQSRSMQVWLCCNRSQQEKCSFLAEDTGPKQKLIYSTGRSRWCLVFFLSLHFLMPYFSYLLVKRAGVRFYEKQGDVCYWLVIIDFQSQISLTAISPWMQYMSVVEVLNILHCPVK